MSHRKRIVLCVGTWPDAITRRVTKRPEAVGQGLAKITGTAVNDIVNAAENLLHNPREYEKIVHGGNPFGDGRAAERIADILSSPLSAGGRE